MNNISVGAELAAFLRQNNHRISAIRPLEAGDSYVQFIRMINRYMIFTDISANYADSIGSAARIIVESLVEELTKEELFTKLAVQMLRHQNVKAYQVKLEDIRYPGVGMIPQMQQESFESKDVICHISFH